MIRAIVLLACLLSVTGCSVLRGVHAEAQRSDLDDYEYEASGPDALVDRLGEPDTWANRKEGDRLYMTATWKCVEGAYREVTWESRVADSGRQFWSVVADKNEKCRRE
jgi:hypothetical protein